MSASSGNGHSRREAAIERSAFANLRLREGRSLELDAGRPDERPPFFDFGLILRQAAT
jgi:hypothetical protein